MINFVKYTYMVLKSNGILANSSLSAFKILYTFNLSPTKNKSKKQKNIGLTLNETSESNQKAQGGKRKRNTAYWKLCSD
jgi:hypothetical protein